MHPYLRWASASVMLCLSIGIASALESTPQLPIPSAQAAAFRCKARDCEMPSQGSYPDLVIGRFQAMATAAQSRQLFADMRARHAWSALPDDSAGFYTALQPVTIALPNGTALAVLMAQDEAHIAQPKPGDLVRYSPHRGKYEIPPADPKARAYWGVDGCVAILCRAQDKACFSRYVSGVYRPADGRALSPRTFQSLPHGTVIDPQTLLPRRTIGATP